MEYLSKMQWEFQKNNVNILNSENEIIIFFENNNKVVIKEIFDPFDFGKVIGFSVYKLMYGFYSPIKIEAKVRHGCADRLIEMIINIRDFKM